MRKRSFLKRRRSCDRSLIEVGSKTVKTAFLVWWGSRRVVTCPRARWKARDKWTHATLSHGHFNNHESRENIFRPKKILHLFKFDPTGPRNGRFTLIIWNESSRTKVHLGFKYLFQHYNLHQTEFETRLPFVSEKIYGNLPDSCGKRFLGEKIDRVSLLQRIKLRFPFIK